MPELEAQLGLPPIALFAVISKYGMDLDIDDPTASPITDVPSPTATLKPSSRAILPPNEELKVVASGARR